ncbi:MAG: flagellar biosynthetic protein FliO [Gammaproteobacteria bacterium]|nr:MAG: flagellar biosynthetic protein FliO [Pseudomonadota bacterium]PIE38097.1 MAG: flagellar biosynthetic protein FliO [Gammaproteobacteria bacterium]
MVNLKASWSLAGFVWLVAFLFCLVATVQAEAGKVGEPVGQTDAAFDSKPDATARAAGDRESIDSRAELESIGKGQPLDTSSAVFNMMLGLAAMIVLIMVIAWAIRRFTNLPGYAGGGQMKITGTLAMGARERIALVEVGNRNILIGVTPQRISTLYVFDEGEIPEQAERSDFAEKLQSMLTRGKSA